MRDRVVVIFATTVATVLVVAAIGLVLIRLDNPDADLGGAVSGIGGALGVLLGFVLGSIRRNGNGA